MIMEEAGQGRPGPEGDEVGSGVHTPHLFLGGSWCQGSSSGYGGRRWELGTGPPWVLSSVLVQA